MDKLDRDTKILRAFRFSIETCILIEKLAKKDKRNNTSYLENEISNRAKYLGIGVSEDDVEEFIEELNEKKKRIKKK